MTDIFAMIADERRILAGDLEKLTDAQWVTPSALSGWQVKHVAAHVVWPLEATLAGTMLAMAMNGFNFIKVANKQAAGEKRPAKELAAVLRAKADHRFTPPGMGPEAPLTDIIIHGQDIRLPLGLAREVPAERMRIVLDNLARGGNQKFFGTPKGFRFAAPDVDWKSAGEGPLVSGPALALAMSMAGRKGMLAQLSGEGADAFRAAFKEYC